MLNVATMAGSSTKRPTNRRHGWPLLLAASRQEHANEQGAQLVSQAGGTVRSLVASVQQVAATVDGITAASIEQLTGIEQVNQAIAQLDDVTQQNAALVEQASAATHSLAEQADSLAQAVAVFRQ